VAPVRPFVASGAPGRELHLRWHVWNLRDAAVINTGISRWHNFYVEGLRWLVENVGIDGIYLDDVAFDRSVMKRIRRVARSRAAKPAH